MMSIDFKFIVILNINGVDYRCIIFGISKSEAIHIFKNHDLSEKKNWIIIRYTKFNFFSCYKNE